jgi:hypothetical protein
LYHLLVRAWNIRENLRLWGWRYYWRNSTSKRNSDDLPF